MFFDDPSYLILDFSSLFVSVLSSFVINDKNHLINLSYHQTDFSPKK